MINNEKQHSSTSKNPLRVLVSGGGTGGHIFPAIAIAQEIRKRIPDAEFLFIGAEGKMEMEKVPQAGFEIKGLKIVGFNRSNLLANLKFPFLLLKSLFEAKKIIKQFNPDIAIGTGGFASGPALYIAEKMKIPVFVQEQNSFPGKTNIILSRKVNAIFTAYPNMEHFFKKTKTFFLGNPVRESIVKGLKDSSKAKRALGLAPEKTTILSVGGSQGSRAINNAWLRTLPHIAENNYQLIWQTGKLDYKSITEQTKNTVEQSEGKIQIREFISDMALAYSAADIIVSRAGAIAISELAAAQKPVLLVPFPNAAEDHQTKNALSLVQENAAKMIKDSELETGFWKALDEICKDEALRNDMAENIKLFAKPTATQDIVDEILTQMNLS
ncbi:undecaprenyldiphospho-muramoylpentapeptide beta-N-acetylglucosaminyltransferase [Riemerella columbipharyngis]|uniref:UDP-N-acetylglucosamine--N-acetylmuramyl-(pentapeptide) pyrophosphoryl-undecaprenol N-acetylglucosamine transferase n=1 Tax=Riemerella columbipharyngis TaxID=1071918 RepID=A0A1G7F4E6_9FLAO|nr:undecaprenyldiphospho-muramoylpentapeptide beta-N-acetylglucosaminyltransferase [Riemerella columbipharyngis]SDE70830.1 UDP-N-acetylglucosamine--N-acetylmuramyl-(pentapeptide) pyrophosphoryl-undecaprenol N-acetylglucosamine transferase [Riemerella columbipharyngis]